MVGTHLGRTTKAVKVVVMDESWWGESMYELMR
jgi:hypothetical protein